LGSVLHSRSSTTKYTTQTDRQDKTLSYLPTWPYHRPTPNAKK
jgi:hypothetical protein